MNSAGGGSRTFLESLTALDSLWREYPAPSPSERIQGCGWIRRTGLELCSSSSIFFPPPAYRDFATSEQGVSLTLTYRTWHAMALFSAGS